MSEYCIITTACNKQEVAKQITNVLLERRLVSCVQESLRFSSYHWKGKIEKEQEYILTMKTKKSLYKEVEQTILSIHDYEVAEIIMMDITEGNSPFLKWIEEETK